MKTFTVELTSDEAAAVMTSLSSSIGQTRSEYDLTAEPNAAAYVQTCTKTVEKVLTATFGQEAADMFSLALLEMSGGLDS